MKTIFYFLIFALLLPTSCTKDATREPATDITGLFDVYGYYDHAGYVPIELIEIRKTGDNHYTATKVLGDISVPTGMTTWQGYRTGNPFTVTFTLGDGKGNYWYQDVDMVVFSNDHLYSDFLKMTLVRRVDGFTP